MNRVFALAIVSSFSFLAFAHRAQAAEKLVASSGGGTMTWEACQNAVDKFITECADTAAAAPEGSKCRVIGDASCNLQTGMHAIWNEMGNQVIGYDWYETYRYNLKCYCRFRPAPPPGGWPLAQATPTPVPSPYTIMPHPAN